MPTRPTSTPLAPAADSAHPDRHAPLTRDQVLRAALEIVDAEGLEALTMRHLASALGVEAMSLYHHVANKDALLDGVVETVLMKMTLPEPAPENWMDLVESMLLAFRRTVAEHPNTIPVLVTRPVNTNVSTSYVEAPVGAIAGAGFAPQQTGELYQSLLAYTFGHALVVSLAPGAAAGTSPLQMSDAVKCFPATVSLDGATRRFDEDGFRRGIRILMRGFAADAGLPSGQTSVR